LGRLRDNHYITTIGFVVVWLAVQTGTFQYGPKGHIASKNFGILYGSDTPRYLEAAKAILMGKFPAGKAQGFLGYDLFTAFFLWSGLGEIGIILTQVLLTLVAAYCLYRLGLRLYDRKAGG
jgi:hypothetical protein